MNKYIFPGADASTPLGWFVDKLEGAGFEIKGVDTIGVHYSATIWRWYRNWMGNKEKIVAKYGKRWFRVSAPQYGFDSGGNLNMAYRSGSSSSHTPQSSPVKDPQRATKSLASRTSTRYTGWKGSTLNSVSRAHWLRPRWTLQPTGLLPSRPLSPRRSQM